MKGMKREVREGRCEIWLVLSQLFLKCFFFSQQSLIMVKKCSARENKWRNVDVHERHQLTHKMERRSANERVKFIREGKEI